MGRMRAFSDFLGLTRPPRGTTRPWQSQRLIEWSRKHPVLDGMFLGVPVLLLLLMLAAAGLLDVSALAVLTIVLLATGLGALMGMRRGRRIQRGES